LDDVLDIPHGEAVTSDDLTVRHDVHVLATRLPSGERAARPWHLTQHALERDANAFDLRQVLAEDLDAHRRPDTDCQHVDASSNRWRDRHLVAGRAEGGVEIAREYGESAGLLLWPEAPQTALHPVRGRRAVP